MDTATNITIRAILAKIAVKHRVLLLQSKYGIGEDLPKLFVVPAAKEGETGTLGDRKGACVCVCVGPMCNNPNSVLVPCVAAHSPFCSTLSVFPSLSYWLCGCSPQSRALRRRHRCPPHHQVSQGQHLIEQLRHQLLIVLA